MVRNLPKKRTSQSFYVVLGSGFDHCYYCCQCAQSRCNSSTDLSLQLVLNLLSTCKHKRLGKISTPVSPSMSQNSPGGHLDEFGKSIKHEGRLHSHCILVTCDNRTRRASERDGAREGKGREREIDRLID